MMHNYEESEAELKAILEAEKWETCYKELKTRWKEKNEDVIFLDEKSCYKLPDIKLPKGYYLFDLYENIENDANEYYDGLSEEEVKRVLESEKWVAYYKEYKEEETRLKEEYEEMVFDFESSGGFLIEELGDYDIMKYYCDSEKQGPTEPHNKYSGDCEWYKGKLYLNTNKLGGYDNYDYYAMQEDDNEPCLSKEELEVERVVWKDHFKEEYPWEFYSLEVLLEEVRKVEEPWEYYPEVLETLWKEDYGDSSKMETNMEILACNNLISKYWGKLNEDDGSFHSLIFHCLDVAAFGHVLLLHDNYLLDKLARNTSLDKETTLSLVTFCLAMHDIGKFSELFQNRGRREIFINKPVNHIGHDELGFYLLHEIWHDNWLNLEQNVDKCDLFNILKPWFQSSTWQHHGKPPQNDLNISQFNLDIHFNEENKVDARFFMKQTVELLLDRETFLLIKQNAFKDTSTMISQLTKWSDHIGSNDELFRYCSKSISIKEYWYKYAIKRAESALEAAVNVSEFLEEDEDIGLILIRKGKSLIECLNNDLGADRANILNEAVKCFEEAAIIDPECRGKELAEKYKHRLERENNDRFSEPAKKVTSDNPKNKDTISKDHIDEKFDRCLFEILRSLRKEHANGNPHFTIFPDKSLRVMATSFPQDLESFKKIPGIGKKYEIYGESFLEKIVTYCKVKETNTERCYPTKLQEILNLCKQNLTLKEIAQKTNLEVNDIIGYIEELILCGAEILDTFVNDAKQEKIKEAMSKVGDESVSDIKRKLNDCFTDADIRFVKAYKIRNDK